MDLTQLLITSLALLGIVVMGLMAIVPTVLEVRDHTDAERVDPVSVNHGRLSRRDDHDLAA